jgi:hypothetical protein
VATGAGDHGLTGRGRGSRRLVHDAAHADVSSARRTRGSTSRATRAM